MPAKNHQLRVGGRNLVEVEQLLFDWWLLKRFDSSLVLFPSVYCSVSVTGCAAVLAGWVRPDDADPSVEGGAWFPRGPLHPAADGGLPGFVHQRPRCLPAYTRAGFLVAVILLLTIDILYNSSVSHIWGHP